MSGDYREILVGTVIWDDDVWPTRERERFHSSEEPDATEWVVDQLEDVIEAAIKGYAAEHPGLFADGPYVL